VPRGRGFAPRHVACTAAIGEVVPSSLTIADGVVRWRTADGTAGSAPV
jgi:hypothetical protein